MKYCIFILLCFSGCAFPSSTGAEEPFPGEIRGLQIDPNPASVGDTIKFDLDFMLGDTTLHNVRLEDVEFTWSIFGAVGTQAPTAIPEFSWVADAPVGEYRCRVNVNAPGTINSLAQSFTFTIED